MEFVEQHEDEVMALSAMKTEINSTEFMPSVGGALFLALNRIDQAQTKEFFDLLAHGGAPKGSPVLALDQRLRRSRRERERLTTFDQLGFGITAWNAFRRGIEMTRVLRPRGQAHTPETIPAPQ